MILRELEKNYTKTPNRLLEALALAGLSGSEYRVVLL